MPVSMSERLRELLRRSDHEAATLSFARAVGTLLADNKTPFFPGYTDHGLQHVRLVLDAADELIPADVWEAKLLTPDDAAVLVLAIHLHDLGMHLHEEGFLELVKPDTRFKAIPWFAESQPRRPSDRPWSELWQSFRREVRRMSQSDLDRLLGPVHGSTPKIAFGSHDRQPDLWTRPDHVLVGEFLRRHHARLAHEMALYGIPGVDDRDLPPLASAVGSLADAVGVVARSHGEELRTAIDYVVARHGGAKNPWNTHVVFLMGLLRVADYFQIDSGRAPALLLHLKHPQSIDSIDEWNKHGAVDRLSWQHTDPRAVYVEVNALHGLRTHLQLQDLLVSLQRELDTTAAVLSETYASSDLARLQLKCQRVRTNLYEPSLCDELGYLPRRARLRSATGLFRLVIKDLYGNHPEVAGREMIQNAVDAVRERRLWEQANGSLTRALSDLPAEVFLEIEAEDEQSGILRVSDRGIGMTADTLIDHYMTAGASFQSSRVNGPERTRSTIATWMKAGRFGLGAFAAFLLGDEVRVTTRHPTESRGLTCTLRMGDELVEVKWAHDVGVGTVVEVPFRLSWPSSSANPATLQLLERVSDFYRMSDPLVLYRHRAPGGAIQPISRDAPVPDPAATLPNRWRALAGTSLEAVLWAVPPPPTRYQIGGPGRLVHNAIEIYDPENRQAARPRWSEKSVEQIFKYPEIAVFDGEGAVGLTLNRYALTERALPFEKELLGALARDFLAHAVVMGMRRHPLAQSWSGVCLHGRDMWWPLWPGVGSPSRWWVVCMKPLMGESHPAAAFVRGHGVWKDWDRYPRRAVIYPDPRPLSPSPWTDRPDRSIVLLADLLGRRPLAFTSWTRGRGSSRRLDTEFPSAALWEVLVESGAHVTWLNTLNDAVASYPDLQNEVDALAEALAAEIPRSAGVVAVFDGGGETASNEVTSIWRRYMGEQGIPYGDAARKSLAQRLASEDPEMADLIARWTSRREVDPPIEATPGVPEL